MLVMVIHVLAMMRKKMKMSSFRKLPPINQKLLYCTSDVMIGMIVFIGTVLESINTETSMRVKVGTKK